MIGKLEELTLLATVRAGPDAHAAKVFGIFEDYGMSSAKFAAVYTTLDRMTKKGLLTERTNPSDPRSKRLFTITGEGRRLLDESVNATAGIGGFSWSGGKGGVTNA